MSGSESETGASAKEISDGATETESGSEAEEVSADPPPTTELVGVGVSGGGTPGGGGGDLGKAKETVVGVLSGGDESPLEDELRAFNTSSMKEGPKSKFISSSSTS